MSSPPQPGWQQAERAAQWLNHRLPHRVRVLASPARRTQETAEALQRTFRTADALAPGASAQDLLADFEGTLILVSHDRDFIDRLATSTIALDGRGNVVETPGGWTDLMDQNPGFFSAVRAPITVAADQYALGVTLFEALSLSPPFPDPATFDKTMKALDKARADLEQAEMEWLELEEKKESLAAG